MMYMYLHVYSSLSLSLSLLGLLLGLLHHLPSLLKQRLEIASCGVQTDQEEKGVKAEEEEKEEDEEEERKETIEKRMIAFQKTCETRNKRALEQEVLHIHVLFINVYIYNYSNLCTHTRVDELYMYRE